MVSDVDEFDEVSSMSAVDSSSEAGDASDSSGLSALEDSVAELEKPPKKGSGLRQVTLHGSPHKAAKSTARESKGKARADKTDDLPPISDIEDIFSDMVDRLSEIEDIARKLDGRKLRVATMCSGTESPLLALRLISRALKLKKGVTLDIEHVFSAEIEPFKQAYIERNFAPPILFRDVTELPNDKAYTAFGSLIEVPGDVDVLIAGTSCKDFSMLNNKRKGLDDNGTSGSTFMGMRGWVERHRPALVILENVCNAPWDEVVQKFSEIEYDAHHVRLDTKDYYIPHTRTRGYAIAVPGTYAKKHIKQEAKKGQKGGKKVWTVDYPNGAVPKRWVQLLKDFQRPSSVPLEEFLLQADDPLLVRARRDLATGSRRGAETDWSRCEDRHAQARAAESLGQKRPLTSWESGGRAQLFIGSWMDWAQGQTERVLDLMEIQFLRLVLDGIDPNYKTIVWNLSQNVDRQGGNAKFAICPCLTPTMIPFITNRGGPASGLEALRLQGIPTRELLLTRENENELADLAGNAMSSTVVGTAIIAGLSLIVDKIVDNRDQESMDVDGEAPEDVAKHIQGDDLLKDLQMDLAKCNALSESLWRDAERSARLCVCEGRASTTDSTLFMCADCGETACSSCLGKPEHRFEPLQRDRLSCGDFEKELKGMLPMRLSLTGFETSALESLPHDGIDATAWRAYADAVTDAIDGAEFRFRSLKRQDVWSVTYACPGARLDLMLDSKQPEWRLTVDCPASEGRASTLRAHLAAPVARLKLKDGATDLLAGTWEIRSPTKTWVELEMQGEGEMLPTWKADLGLLRDEIPKQKRWSSIRISVPEDAISKLDVDVTGLYRLLPNCGTAEGMLHKRVDNDASEPLHLLLDPTRDGPGSADCVVITSDCRRHDYGFVRPIVCKLKSSWRPGSETGPQTLRALVEASWRPAPDVRCIATASVLDQMPNASQSATEAADSASCRLPAEPLKLSFDASACTHAQSILGARVPLAAVHADAMWPKEAGWHEVDLTHKSKTVFDALAWVTERLPSLDVMSEFTELELTAIEAPEHSHACGRCAPCLPSLRWEKSAKGNAQYVGTEDPVEAGAYEQALKKRPPPFVVQLRYENGYGEFRIGLNIAALVHRALGRLPRSAALTDASFSWRMTAVDPNDLILAYRPKAKFEIGSNIKDKESEQPPHFNDFPLRVEQLRALTWMKSQEKSSCAPFIEEEVSEAFLAPMGWRAEGRAERPKYVFGGVLADEVGFGKTATTVGLIDATADIEPKIPKDVKAKHICVNATLIIVPGHLCEQWPSEITKFVRNKLKAKAIKSIDQLKKLSVQDIEELDIIIAPPSLFNELYWQRASLFGCSDVVPRATDGKASRHFLARLDATVEGTQASTAMLKKDGGKAVVDAIKSAMKKGDAKPVGKGDGDADLWKLSSCKRGSDYDQMMGPPLHCFHFKRLVIDEYTYLDGQIRAIMTAISASYRWILSGTPPLSNFTEISSIASLLDIHLGTPDYDDAEGTFMKNAFDAGQKLRKDDSTSAERFHAFREMHSTAWHTRRDGVAQSFLDRYARCNQAEIEAIKMDEELQKVVLTPAERAIYVELEHHIQNADYNPNKLARLRKERDPSKKAKSSTADKEDKKGAVSRLKAGDRELRMGRALGQSATPQEALLKRCSHFTLDFEEADDVAHADEACDMIKAARERDLREAKEDLEEAVGFAADLHRHLDTPHGSKSAYGEDDNIERKRWIDWIDTVFSPSKALDAEVFKIVQEIVTNCGLAADRYKSKTRDKSDHSAEFKEFLKESGSDWTEQGRKDQAWRMRVQVTAIKKLIRELATRIRSLRFYNIVRDVQQGTIDPSTSASSNSVTKDTENEPLAVLSCCGHTGPLSLLTQKASKQTCVEVDCDAPVRATSVVRCDTLLGDQTHTVFGTKLEQIVDCIKNLPSESKKQDRTLVFVQFADLLEKVEEALTAHGVKSLTITGTAKARSDTLQSFQMGEGDARVLLLNLGDASASGANLTIANHAIFVSPFLQAQDKYDATETQAIGRIRRCGQEKTVHIHRFIAMDTIDRTIYGERCGRTAEAIDAELDACKPFTISKASIAISQRIKQERLAKPKAKEDETEQKPSKGKGKAVAKPKAAAAPASKRKKAAAESEDESDSQTKVKKPARKVSKKAASAVVVDDTEEEPISPPTELEGKQKAAEDSMSDVEVSQSLSPARLKAQPQPPGKKRPSTSKPTSKGPLDSFFGAKKDGPKTAPAKNGSLDSFFNKKDAPQPSSSKRKLEDNEPKKEAKKHFSIIIPSKPKLSSQSQSSSAKQLSSAIKSKAEVIGGRAVIIDSSSDDE